jgi:hypothetical protein
VTDWAILVALLRAITALTSPTSGDARVPVAAPATIHAGINNGEPTVALDSSWVAFGCFGPVRQSKTSQRHAGKAEAEFLKRGTPRDGLGHAPGEFVEFVVHVSPENLLIHSTEGFIRVADPVLLTADVGGRAVSVAFTEQTGFAGFGFWHQPKAGQRHPGEANAEFSQGRSARNRLSQALRQFIEFVVHGFPF